MSKQDLINHLAEMYSLYKVGELGAQGVIWDNKCCTVRDMKDFVEYGQPNERSFEKYFEAISKMHDIYDDRDIREVLELKKLFKEYYEDCKIGFEMKKIIEKFDDKLKYKNRFIDSQFERFNNFSSNQDLFDNTISILKISQRFNCEFNKYLNTDFIVFDNQGISFENIEKEMKHEILKEYGQIRFTL